MKTQLLQVYSHRTSSDRVIRDRATLGYTKEEDGGEEETYTKDT
jgi:hypothetical protein